MRPGPERGGELFDFKKENQAENILYLERSGSPEQAVRREICLWYVIQDLMKLQDTSGLSGQGEEGRPLTHSAWHSLWPQGPETVLWDRTGGQLL